MKSKFGNKIRANTEARNSRIPKEKQRQRDLAYELNDSSKIKSFNRDLHLKEGSKEIARSLLLDTLDGKENQITDFEKLTANLLCEGSKYLLCPKGRNYWKKTVYHQASYHIPKLVDLLYAQKFIKLFPGSYDRTRKRGKVTKIVATSKLLNLFPNPENSIEYAPKQFVILREEKHKSQPNRKSRKLIDFDVSDSSKFSQIKRRKVNKTQDILMKVNLVNTEADIRYKNEKLSGLMFAIFNGDFKYNGRLYSRAGKNAGSKPFQVLSSKKRSKITIDGEPVVEIDYSSLHPMMLYAQKGIQYDLSKDPYSEIDNRKELRPFLKAILLRMINSEHIREAEGSADKWLINVQKSKKKKKKTIAEDLRKIGVGNSKPFIQKALSVHSRISDFFFKDKKLGQKLAHKDSKIALAVVNHFAQKGIPVLSMHDSFIVQKKYKEELLKVMKEAYKKEIKYDIKVEEK